MPCPKSSQQLSDEACSLQQSALHRVPTKILRYLVEHTVNCLWIPHIGYSCCCCYCRYRSASAYSWHVQLVSNVFPCQGLYSVCLFFSMLSLLLAVDCAAHIVSINRHHLSWWLSGRGKIIRTVQFRIVYNSWQL